MKRIRLKLEAEFDLMSEPQAWKMIVRFMNKYSKDPRKQKNREFPNGLNSLSMKWSTDIPSPIQESDEWL